MRKLFPAKSKKGVTLVEAVIAVVVLGLFATGILNLLTAGSSKIHKTFADSATYTEASAQLDLVIAAISNGSEEFIIKDLNTEPPTCKLDIAKLLEAVGLGEDTQITAQASLYDNLDASGNNPLYPAETVLELTEIRGWYITLTYQGVTLNGFASNSEGVFDN